MTKFEDFIEQMTNNWPSAFQNLYLPFPRLGKIANHVDKKIAQLMEEHELIPSDFHLLTAIRRSHANSPYQLKPSELLDYMLFSWGGITKVMARLEEKGIIVRVMSEYDKRIRMIQLTPLGESIIENVVTQLQAYHKQLLAGFQEDEIILLDTLLEKLVVNVEREEANR